MSYVDRGGQALWFLNTRVHVVVPASAGEDRISVLQHWAPFGDSPPLHIHTTEDEVFRVLSGRFRFRVGDQEHQLQAGETLLAPKNIPHSYCIESPEGGSWITVTTSGDFEGLVRNTSRPAENDGLPPPIDHPTPEQIQALTDACHAHNIEIVGPPLTPSEK
jgi:quercetin dioxygenase-like cupin family protein